MALTDETAVRHHTGLLNPAQVSAAVIDHAIASAHDAIRREIDPAFEDSTDARLKTAETELASAHLLRSLASQAAFEDRTTGVAGLSRRETRRAERLLEIARDEEDRAWARLAPFMKPGRGRFGFALAEPDSPAGSGR